MKMNLNKPFGKLVVLVTLIAIVFSSTMAFADSGNSLFDQAKSNMLSLGFSQQTINDLSESEIMQYLNAKLAYKTDEYYRFEYSLQYDEKTKQDKVLSVNKHKTTKEEAIKNAPIENEKDFQRKIDRLKRDKENADVVKAAGYNNSYNSSRPYVTSAYMKMEIWATYSSGSTYKISSRIEWISYPAEANIDMFALSNDWKTTKSQNSSFFVAKADVYYKDIYGANTLQYTETIKESYSPFKEEMTGVGYDYAVPQKVIPGSSRHWYERKALRAYISYNILVPSTKNVSYGVLASYSHEKTYITWSNSIGVSYPLGISFSSWPTGESKTDTVFIYTNFLVN